MGEERDGVPGVRTTMWWLIALRVGVNSARKREGGVGGGKEGEVPCVNARTRGFAV